MKPGKNVRRYVGRKQQDSAASPEYFLTHAVPRSKPYPYASKRQNERQEANQAWFDFVKKLETISGDGKVGKCKYRGPKIERFTCPAQKQLTA